MKPTTLPAARHHEPAQPFLPPLDRDRRIPALSLVMPAYNEEAAIGASIEEAVRVLEEIAGTWELIVADDGSSDGTAAIVTAWSRREPRVRLLSIGSHVGYGPALAKGLHEARLEVVAYTDADAQFELGELAQMHRHLDGVDMVVGHRVGRQDPLVRRFTSRVYGQLVRAALGVRVHDVNCAMKMFRRSFLQRLELQSGGFLIDAEMFARARAMGASWRAVPVTHRPRRLGSSSIRVATVIETLRELLRLRRSLAHR